MTKLTVAFLNFASAPNNSRPIFFRKTICVHSEKHTEIRRVACGDMLGQVALTDPFQSKGPQIADSSDQNVRVTLIWSWTSKFSTLIATTNYYTEITFSKSFVTFVTTKERDIRSTWHLCGEQRRKLGLVRERKRDHLENLGVDGRILKWILKKSLRIACTALFWLRIQINGWMLWKRKLTKVFHKLRGISRVDEKLLIREAGLCSMESVNQFVNYLIKVSYSSFNDWFLIMCTDCNLRKGKNWTCTYNLIFLYDLLQFLPRGPFPFRFIDQNSVHISLLYHMCCCIN